ncbi:GlcG/HbpS family heme-binding protein [Scleromatobacter humisilvae]|uniref:Heme-binding protein n=1 Tax=Scleromatobacter humisilvae TaxID=2897159 RepID=A0A9X2C1A3_9BURK|nr:heme-binding protein [Scleromatobacter humisilvae]MCK9688067.1 heme-binding protein [Scleromatobacter humisilvae]
MDATYATASINRDAAQALIEAARAASRDLGIRVTIAVTDAGGHLAALARDDGAPFLTVDVAIDKAWTATSFGLPTHVWSDVIANPQVAQLAHRPRLVAVGGGVPIVSGGRVVGGIGISGGNAQQDRDAAEIALKALGFELAS